MSPTNALIPGGSTVQMLLGMGLTGAGIGLYYFFRVNETEEITS